MRRFTVGEIVHFARFSINAYPMRGEIVGVHRRMTLAEVRAMFYDIEVENGRIMYDVPGSLIIPNCKPNIPR